MTKKEVERMEFVGAKMGNILHAVAHDTRVPPELRTTAEKAYTQWDSISKLLITNPITMMKLEKKYFPEA
jgi:uncharacterized protein (UPF0147 family)